MPLLDIMFWHLLSPCTPWTTLTDCLSETGLKWPNTSRSCYNSTAIEVPASGASTISTEWIQPHGFGRSVGYAYSATIRKTVQYSNQRRLNRALMGIFNNSSHPLLWFFILWKVYSANNFLPLAYGCSSRTERYTMRAGCANYGTGTYHRIVWCYYSALVVGKRLLDVDSGCELFSFMS